MIKIEGISKTFGKVIALTEVNLEVGKGEIFGLIGPNGAGKTTLLRILVGEIKPEMGRVIINDVDKDPDKDYKLKEIMAFLSETREALNEFTALDYRNLYRKLYPNWSDKIFLNLLENFKIPQERKYKNLSMGNKTALLFALTIATRASLILLDEPTQHLDPERRYIALEQIRRMNIDNGTTFIISSHQIDELEDIVTSFAVLKSGSILYFDSVDKAKEYHRIAEKVKNPDTQKAIAVLENGEILIKCEEEEDDFGRYPKLKEIVVGYLRKSTRE